MDFGAVQNAAFVEGFTEGEDGAGVEGGVGGAEFGGGGFREAVEGEATGDGAFVFHEEPSPAGEEIAFLEIFLDGNPAAGGLGDDFTLVAGHGAEAVAFAGGAEVEEAEAVGFGVSGPAGAVEGFDGADEALLVVRLETEETLEEFSGLGEAVAAVFDQAGHEEGAAGFGVLTEDFSEDFEGGFETVLLDELAAFGKAGAEGGGAFRGDGGGGRGEGSDQDEQDEKGTGKGGHGREDKEGPLGEGEIAEGEGDFGIARRTGDGDAELGIGREGAIGDEGEEDAAASAEGTGAGRKGLAGGIGEGGLNGAGGFTGDADGEGAFAEAFDFIFVGEAGDALDGVGDEDLKAVSFEKGILGGFADAVAGLVDEDDLTFEDAEGDGATEFGEEAGGAGGGAEDDGEEDGRGCATLAPAQAEGEGFGLVFTRGRGEVGAAVIAGGLDADGGVFEGILEAGGFEADPEAEFAGVVSGGAGFGEGLEGDAGLFFGGEGSGGKTEEKECGGQVGRGWDEGGAGHGEEVRP